MNVTPIDDGVPAFRTPEESWEYTRLQNLLQFASATPDQKVEWLADTLEMLTAIRRLPCMEAEAHADFSNSKSDIFNNLKSQI